MREEKNKEEKRGETISIEYHALRLDNKTKKKRKEQDKEGKNNRNQTICMRAKALL